MQLSPECFTNGPHNVDTNDTDCRLLKEFRHSPRFPLKQPPRTNPFPRGPNPHECGNR